MLTGKKWLLILIFVLAALMFWQFGLPKVKYAGQIPAEIKDFSGGTIASVAQNLGSKISAPPPLTGTEQNPSSALTDAGVILWTNANRRQNGGLKPLSEDKILDQEASAKLADMFQQQYFEHINPQGHGPDYLATTYGYAYIAIGENLALGNFKDDQDLLTAWMNSPGHRANILNTKYQQIGVAVGQGEYQGQKTWLAVQEFGEPTSACPGIDQNLKAEIATMQTQVNQSQAQLTVEKAQIDEANPQTQSDYDAYNKQIADYNSQIAIYNNTVDKLKLDIASYNSEVNAYNTCAKG